MTRRKIKAAEDPWAGYEPQPQKPRTPVCTMLMCSRIPGECTAGYCPTIRAESAEGQDRYDRGVEG